jgi:hypothetical protein
MDLKNIRNRGERGLQPMVNRWDNWWDIIRTVMDIPVANFEVSMVFILRLEIIWVVSMSNRVIDYRRFEETKRINNTATHRNNPYDHKPSCSIS